MTAAPEPTSGLDRVPRAVRWAGLAVLLIGAFLLWDGKIRSISDDWARDADRIERDVQTVHNTGALGDQLKRMGSTITSVGPVDIPGGLAPSHDELNRIVNELLKQYRVNDDSFVSRPEGRLGGKNVLSEITGGRTRVHTIKGDLAFESSAEDATAIIAALESDPAIELIRSLRLNKLSGGKVKVRLILEAWVLDDEKS